MSAFNDVTDDMLRRLAGTCAPGQTVLSVYLDLDPARFATAPARASEIDSLLDAAHREIERAERPHEDLLALRAAHDRARALLQPVGSAARGARALALFVCEQLELELLLRLDHPVSSAVFIADAPFIAPLVDLDSAGRVCVTLVDERFARVLRGSAERLREVVSFGDDVHGRHSQGGWSQARYQRSIDEDVESHLRRCARVLQDPLKVQPYDCLLIACTEPLWPRVTEKLHPDVCARLHPERLAVDLSDVTVTDVERAAAPALAAEQRELENEVLATLREHHARDGDGRAASGLREVLQALVERRVQALLYEAALHAPGVVCSRCGWLAPDGERCPVDDQPLRECEDILELAVQAAVNQSAKILPLRERPELGPLGGIAATLRF